VRSPTAFEDRAVKMIGDEPANTDYDPGLSEKALSQGEGGWPQGFVARHQLYGGCCSARSIPGRMAMTPSRDELQRILHEASNVSDI
jgi:hypothetical protein